MRTFLPPRTGMTRRPLPRDGVVGVRAWKYVAVTDRKIRPFTRNFHRHLLMLVENGVAVFRRNGPTSLARSGDALLIPAGHCSVQFLPVVTGLGISVIVVEFDLRAVAKNLRENYLAETVALQRHEFPASGIVLHDFVTHAQAGSKGIGVAAGISLRCVFNLLQTGQWPAVFAFTRSVFYERRWKLLAMLEKHVIAADGEAQMAATYEGGAKKLRRDCEIFLGGRPRQLLRRRRAQIAAAWLRCGHSIDNVAKALSFSSRREFQCEFAAHLHRRCEDVQKQTPLTTVEIEDLLTAIRPVWWPPPLPLTINIPPRRDDLFPRGMFGREIEEDVLASERARGCDILAENAATRAAVTSQVHERATAFFAMKATAAEIVVPIFEQSPPPIQKAA